MSDFYNQKDETYYQSYNTVLVNLIPEQAKRIVDIGCSSGRLGEVLKERNGAYVTGIEHLRKPLRKQKKYLIGFIMETSKMKRGRIQMKPLMSLFLVMFLNI
ncbi:class I SAM-dependent methyltransferase [Geomicrobium sp. JCM 19038]|uniref:class I SAM-dependent methyltransferase n=1 Tax=Geomicrobium sp. JCM 19038 TaxID=1460635 RepID=UPI001268B207|nr:class I SAM-dependent methyltransferase [Geomicrobium sp. JCM 19038]